MLALSCLSRTTMTITQDLVHAVSSCQGQFPAEETIVQRFDLSFLRVGMYVAAG
jgi:hypothetical protein